GSFVSDLTDSNTDCLESQSQLNASSSEGQSFRFRPGFPCSIKCGKVSYLLSECSMLRYTDIFRPVTNTPGPWLMSSDYKTLIAFKSIQLSNPYLPRRTGG
ncbi:hypothetical protein AVEN_53621-1, partial [Araneus ventricosus]